MNLALFSQIEIPPKSYKKRHVGQIRFTETRGE